MINGYDNVIDQIVIEPFITPRTCKINKCGICMAAKNEIKKGEEKAK